MDWTYPMRKISCEFSQVRGRVAQRLAGSMFGRRRNELRYLRRVVNMRVEIWTPSQGAVVDATLEELYLVVKYGHEGRMLVFGGDVTVGIRYPEQP